MASNLQTQDSKVRTPSLTRSLTGIVRLGHLIGFLSIAKETAKSLQGDPESFYDWLWSTSVAVSQISLAELEKRDSPIMFAQSYGIFGMLSCSGSSMNFIVHFDSVPLISLFARPNELVGPSIRLEGEYSRVLRRSRRPVIVSRGPSFGCKTVSPEPKMQTYSLAFCIVNCKHAA